MAENTELPAVVETSAVVAPPADTVDTTLPAAAVAAPPPPAAPPPVVVEPQPQDWRERRIGELTAKLRAAEAKAKAELPAPPAAPVVNQAEIDRLANIRAQELNATTEFNRMCNEAAGAGRLAFPDFDTKLNEMKRLAEGGDANTVSAYNTMIAAALETGDAPKVIHYLGGNLNEASRIMSMPPMKMAVELTKIATGAARTFSQLPKPITPIGSRGGQHEEIDPADAERSDRLATATWMERREAQVKAAARQQ
jgi:hypothetical protein